jgi:hypothetical protein
MGVMPISHALADTQASTSSALPLPAQTMPTSLKLRFTFLMVAVPWPFHTKEPRGPFNSTVSPTRSWWKPVVILPPSGNFSDGRYNLGTSQI